MRLSLYTDGASHAKGNLPGGWAWVLVDEHGPRGCGSGGLEATTNNAMELTAILEGLLYVMRFRGPRFAGLTELDVVSDSQYALGVSSGKFNASKNTDLVNAIQVYVKSLSVLGIEVRWHWVRGHNGQTWNERADRLAQMAKQEIISRQTGRTKTPS